jgi:hypothetical protein
MMVVRPLHSSATPPLNAFSNSASSAAVLVEQDDRRVLDQRARDGDALAPAPEAETPCSPAGESPFGSS